MEFDLLIRDARTRHSQGNLLDIGIKNGRILKIGEIPSAKGQSYNRCRREAGHRIICQRPPSSLQGLHADNGR